MTKGEAFKNSTLFLSLTTKNGYKAGKLYSIKASNGNGDFVWDRASTAYRMNQEGVLEEMVTDVPRVDYTNTCPELLIEGQSTNIIHRSQQFDNAAWNKNNNGTGSLPIVTANDTLAPDDTLTADKIVFNSGAGTNITDLSTINQTPSVSAGNYTGSIWLKGSVGGEQILFRHVGVSNYTLLTLTTNWVRYKLSEVQSGSNFELGIRQATNIGIINSSATIYAWGAQLEALPYATSYIPTPASANVTRVRDISTNITTDFSGLKGTIFVRARVEDSSFVKDDTILSLWGDDTDHYILIYSDKDRNIKIFTYENPDQNDYSYALASDGICNIAVGYDFSGVNNKLNIAINGVLKRANASQSSASPTILNTLELGNLIGTLPQIDNRVIGVMWFDSQLSDSDLVNITA